MGKTVKIFCMGDSLTEGDGNPSAYRYPLFERLFKAGADFRFVGPSSSRDDVRLPALYNHHGGNCGYIIGTDSDEGGGSLRKNLRNPEYSKYLKDVDIILLWIGANDSYQSIDMEHIGDRYTDLLHVIWGFAPNATVYGAEMINAFAKDDALDKWIRETAPAKFSAEGHKFIPVKLDPVGRKLKEEYGDHYDGDGHPTEEGNCKIADSWFEAIIGEITEINKNGVDDGTEPLIRAERIELCANKDKIALGESLTFSAKVYPENASVKTVLFKSSDTGIASVDRYGRLFPKRCGEVTVIAETLDGAHRAEKKITVSGISDMTLGMTKIYVSDLTSDKNWSGATDRIEKKYNKFQVRYLGEPQEIRAEKFTINSERVLLKFTHRTANHGGRSRDNYSSVKLGELELRICALASVVELYESGKLIGEYSGVPIAAICDEFSLKVENGKASVYRNGELLFESELAQRLVSGGLKLYWQEFYAKSEIKNVEVYI